jgi:hypothetical protein
LYSVPPHEAEEVAMTVTETLTSIRHALDTAPRKAWTAEMHLQMIKHAEALANVSGRKFCEALRIPAFYGSHRG